jgi:hypothetical protein
MHESKSAHGAPDIESTRSVRNIDSPNGTPEIESAHGAGKIMSTWCTALPKAEPPGGGVVMLDMCSGAWVCIVTCILQYTNYQSIQLIASSGN